MITEIQFLLISLIASVFHLDTLVFGQFMFHRPIIVGPLIGILIGTPQYGVLMGCILELVYLSLIPVGIKVPPDVTSTTVCSLVSYKLSNGNLFFSLILGILLGILYRYIDLLTRTLNSMVINWVDNAKDEVVTTRINLLVVYGIVSTYFRSVLFYLLVFPLLNFFMKNIDKIGLRMLFSSELIYILPAIGIGISISHFVEK